MKKIFQFFILTIIMIGFTTSSSFAAGWPKEVPGPENYLNKSHDEIEATAETIRFHVGKKKYFQNTVTNMKLVSPSHVGIGISFIDGLASEVEYNFESYKPITGIKPLYMARKILHLKNLRAVYNHKYLFALVGSKGKFYCSIQTINDCNTIWMVNFSTLPYPYKLWGDVKEIK